MIGFVMRRIDVIHRVPRQRGLSNGWRWVAGIIHAMPSDGSALHGEELLLEVFRIFGRFIQRCLNVEDPTILLVIVNLSSSPIDAFRQLQKRYLGETQYQPIAWFSASLQSTTFVHATKPTSNLTTGDPSRYVRRHTRFLAPWIPQLFLP